MNYIIIESKDVELILELYSEIFNQEKKLPKEFIYTIFEELKTYLAYDPHNEGVLVEKNLFRSSENRLFANNILCSLREGCSGFNSISLRTFL